MSFKMIIEVKGEIELKPSIIETALESRLKKHGITLGEAFQFEGTLFGNPATIYPPFLFTRKTADKNPSAEYFLELSGKTKSTSDSKNINQFVKKLNNKRYHLEKIEFHIADYQYFVSNFRNNIFKYFIMDDCEEFAIPFIQNAFRGRVPFVGEI